MKNKKRITIIAIVTVAVILIIAVVGKYNSLVDAQEETESLQSTISVQLQRRADLIPNFVASVKGYSDYEKETLTAVTEARASVGKASTPKEQAEASAELDKAISVWVNAVTEAYPDLKANTQYVALQDELAGSENRLATARKDYNDAAKNYNSSIRKFPGSIVAGIFGFDKLEYFEASAGSENVPQVDFS